MKQQKQDSGLLQNKILKRTQAVSKTEQGQDKIQDQKEENDSKNLQNVGRSTMMKNNLPRNVNYYSHFFEHAYITEKDIDWVLKLRSANQDMSEILKKIPQQSFQVYDKKIQSQDKLHTVQDISLRGSISNHEHLLKKRIGPSSSLSQVEFETSLRNSRSKDTRIQELEKGFSSVPKKDRKEYPQFLPKIKEEKEIKKKIEQEQQEYKNMNIQQKKQFKLKETHLTYSALDGYKNYPQYTFKLKSTKNLREVRHLYSPDTFMSTINWEMNLR